MKSNRSTFIETAAYILPKVWQLPVLGLAVAIPLAIIAFARDESRSQSTSDSEIAHGKYLVHHVALCIECHTPRSENGSLIESRLLQGAPIPVKGPSYAAPWAAQSVDLAGLGNYDDSFVRFLLMNGKRPDGTTVRSPMPVFRLSESDANSIIAYLKTL